MVISSSASLISSKAMAYTSQAFFTTFFFVLLVSLALETVAGRNIPADSKLHPEFLGFDGTVLIPGVGCVMLPEKGQHRFITIPSPTGGDVSLPGVGDLTGGDDMTLPNPIGGALPAPPTPPTP